MYLRGFYCILNSYIGVIFKRIKMFFNLEFYFDNGMNVINFIYLNCSIYFCIDGVLVRRSLFIN